MATQANYASTPKLGMGTVSTANTNRDGTGTVATIFTAGSSGSKINEIRLKATGQTAAGIVCIFVHDGTNYRLLTEIAVTAITPGTTTTSFESTPVRFADLDLPSGYTIRASITVAPTSGVVNVIVEGGDF